MTRQLEYSEKAQERCAWMEYSVKMKKNSCDRTRVTIRREDNKSKSTKNDMQISMSVGKDKFWVVDKFDRKIP